MNQVNSAFRAGTADEKFSLLPWSLVSPLNYRRAVERQSASVF
jgi:hypothetical protein